MSKKVKKTLPGFASSMSGGNMDVLKKIVKNHYKEFLQVYRMLENSVDGIVSLDYEDLDGKNLSIQVTMEDTTTARNLQNSAQLILEKNMSRYGGMVSCYGKSVEISIEPH